MEKDYLTPQGYTKLLNLLDLYIKEKLPESIKAISDSQENGGGELSENAEYLHAMEERDKIENKIKELTAILDNCQCIDIKTIKEDGKVRFGSTVTIYDIDMDKEFTYKIVGVLEADIKEGSVSYKSPVGKALIGSNVEDEVYLDTPNGDRSLEILAVKHV